MNCNKCLQELHINNIEKHETQECSGCNLGVFSNGCGCKSYKVLIQEYWCKNCNIQLEKCKICNNCYDKLINNTCEICIEKIKNNNPSNEYCKYIFDDKYLSWEIFEKKYVCVKCKIGKIYNIHHSKFNYYNSEYMCVCCKINNLNIIYTYNFKFTIDNNENIIFRKKCICNEYTDNIDIFYIDKEYILQCKNCNPSSDYESYKYCCSNVWKIDKIGKKCNKCNTILWKNFGQQYEWGHIIQCIEHKPINDNIKFKFTNSGYVIEKIKSFSGKKHVWKNAYTNNLNYKCDCIKCNS